MNKLQLSLFVFLGLVCLTWGWEPGTQYVYKYVGRSIAGIKKLKQQNAIIELSSSVTVQSVDEYTLLVQLTETRVKRHGYYLDDPYHIGENGQPEEIEGEEDDVADLEAVYTPFSIYHTKGSISSVKVGADEPLWVVNLKKSIAGQLQLDITGVRADGAGYNKYAAKEGDKATFNVYEDSVTGDCSTTIEISRLPHSQVLSSNAFKVASFESVCGDKPVFQIIKTKDFNNCKTNPTWHSTTSDVYTCDFDKANCGDFLKRTAVYKYVTCGDSLTQSTVVQANGYSDLMAQPFATKTDELANAVVTKWSLVKKESISYKFAIPSYPREHKSLAYVFGDFEQLNQDGTPAKPNLRDALIKSPAPVEALKGSILDGLYVVAEDLKNTYDAGQDNIDRLAVMTRVLAMLSLDELRDLWDDVKGKDFTTLTLFVDVVVQAGSNPSVMLIKELIETEQITGHTANFAMSALGYYVKTPTRELLKELVDLTKSDAVKSSKTLQQISMITVSDLLSAACGNRLSAAKRFTTSVLGDFCDRKDTIITKDFLPLLSNELESSKSVFDRIVALATLGSLSVEEVVPILLPVIRGNGNHDDTAERVRAILSLSRVVFTAPEKVHPILVSLAGNTGERPEVRMAALSLLFLSNAPEPLWKRFASNTWIEPSKQVASFIHTLVLSLTKAPASTPLIAELARKANLVAPLVKPCPFGLPYSFHDIQSSSLDEGIAVMMHTISMRDSDQKFPVYLSNVYFYQLGPLNREPFTISMWNFNMADLWQTLFSKFYRGVSVKYDAPWSEKKGDKKGDIIKGIWEQLKASAKPGDKRAGLLHINLLGSINRFVNLESLEEEIPKFMAQSMKNNESKKPLEVNMIKYRMLGEYNVRFATDLGLPMRYMFTLPLLFSIFGTVNTDGKLGLTSDLTTELSWKITGEVRVDIPFSGNHIATGVDVLVESHAPRLMTFNYHKGHLEFGWITDNKVTDLFHYHVKPYTLTRSTVKPSLEGQDLWIISVTDKPIQREIDFGAKKNFGVNVKLTEVSELPHGDKFAWDKYIAKWDINSISNMGFVPSELNYRKYVIRYDPNGTKAKTINTSYFYQYATKSAKSNLIYESGTNTGRYPSEPEIVSYSPIVADFRPLALTMFKDIDSGNARLMTASLVSTHADGTVDKLTSTAGMSMNVRYTKDCTDWQVEYSTTKPGQSKNVNFAICYSAVRKWNHPPTFGFSKDILEMTEEDRIGFGPNCEHKVHFTAKLTRDEAAAEAAKNSEAGKQCLKDMAYGFQYGSPACAKARIMDHTYNNYELVSQAENMSDAWLQWARTHTTWINQNLEPFMVEHKHAQTNTPNRASWTIKRDPITGDCDMTFVRPHETMIAKNVRWGDKIRRFSPLTDAFSKIYFPLTASSNFILDSLSLVSAGISDKKCYVGDNAVHTFDGAHYKYTLNECQHVLMTDCHQKSELAVLARTGKEGQKIVTVIYGADTFEIDPIGYYITVNGAKTDYTKMEKGSHIEIRPPGAKSVKVVIFPLADGGVILDIRTLQFFLKVQGSNVDLSAPVHMRGRACGLCGDFNQEDNDEFKTADRCAVSSGDLMAASFILDGCYADKGIASRLKKETATCKSADQQFYTYLADYDVNSSASKCTRYDGKCKSSYAPKDSYRLYV